MIGIIARYVEAHIYNDTVRDAESQLALAKEVDKVRSVASLLALVSKLI